MMPETQETKPKPRRLTKYLLIGSVALNLVIIGVVGGAVIGFKRDGGGHKAGERFGSPHVQALSFEDRRIVGRAIRNAYRAEDVSRQSEKYDYRQVTDVLRASPFERAALYNLLAEMDNASETRRQVARAVLTEQIENMSDAERSIYADRLEEILSKLAERKKHKHRQTSE